MEAPAEIVLVSFSYCTKIKLFEGFDHLSLCCGKPRNRAGVKLSACGWDEQGVPWEPPFGASTGGGDVTARVAPGWPDREVSLTVCSPMAANSSDSCLIAW